MPRKQHTGVIKTWNNRDWGLVRPDGMAVDVFLHIKACKGFVPEEGDKVVFSLAPGARDGLLRAVDVKLAPPAMLDLK
jgi:cold shock CspA family protein